LQEADQGHLAHSFGVSAVVLVRSIPACGGSGKALAFDNNPA
jgi:hypothetical protein